MTTEEDLLDSVTFGWTVRHWLRVEARPVQWFAHAVLSIPLFVGWRLHFIGRENIPRSGTVLATPNHTSWVDPLIQNVAHFRVLRFMGKAELISARGVGWLMRYGGVFPVRRNQGDAVAVDLARLVLDDGQYLVVYPEGTRCRTYGGGMGRARSGAARLALQTGCRVLPIATYGLQPGTGREHLPSWLRRLPLVRRVTTVYGEPYEIAAEPDASRERVAEVRDEIFARIETVYLQARAANLGRRPA